MLQGWIQIALTLLIIVAITPALGNYMARVYQEQKTLLDPIFNPVEKLLYALSGVQTKENMTGWQYSKALLYSNLAVCILVGFILFNQGWLPFNPTGLSSSTSNTPSWDVILHTVSSFITGADQQHYSGETTYSYFSQSAGLGFMFFIAAASGLAIGIAFIRGLTGKPLGNFYIDLIRSITRILLPFSLVLGMILVATGVPETLGGLIVIPTLENPHTNQAIALGPVAHLEIMKQIGENGGGFFAANSAHPFENPNSFSNLIVTVGMVAIPAAFIYTYGVISNDLKQAWLLYGIVLAFCIGFIIIDYIGEYNGNPLVNKLLGGQFPNLEGKEIRLGVAQSSLFSVLTTGTMTGTFSGVHDSFMPSGSFVMLSNMFLQMVWGGQGTGAAYLFVYVILAVFTTGLMVGRTPEFLGRKIEKREVVLASLLILLIHPILILLPGAIAISFPSAPPTVMTQGFYNGISNPGFHGLVQIFYEYTSAAANNGSGMAGLGNEYPAPSALWWNLSCVLPLLLGRYVPAVALLLLADSMYHKQKVPMNSGTLRTNTGLFTNVTAGVILVMGALTFLPILVLGSIAEAFEIAKAAL